MKTSKRNAIAMSLLCLQLVSCKSNNVEQPKATTDKPKVTKKVANVTPKLIPAKVDALNAAALDLASNFYASCMKSLNETDAESPLRNRVVNAMALVNTSKVARSVAITKVDFERLSKSFSFEGQKNGLVYIGTMDDRRNKDSSYSHYAFTRLPSLESLDYVSYRHFSLDENGNPNGYNVEHINEFLLGDQLEKQKSIDDYYLVVSQNPQRAIDANRIESYNEDDCQKTATYMANAGSKALTDSVDEPLFRATNLYNTHNAHDETDKMVSLGSKIRSKEGVNHVVSDQLELLNRRWENLRTDELKKRYRDRDSKRIIVLQDNLLRKTVHGNIDYSFLDLVDMPHLRFFAAVDSEIGKSERTAGDFDNDFKGKKEALVEFVQRHFSERDRKDNQYKGLEAVFVRIEEPKEEVVEEVFTPRPAKNLFHAPINVVRN